jgi:hypothetical protein
MLLSEHLNKPLYFESARSPIEAVTIQQQHLPPNSFTMAEENANPDVPQGRKAFVPLGTSLNLTTFTTH